jgi:NAD(P)-dependent dehydrogenase (short-subunit alcohol dehydrogenase family)
MSKAAVIQMTKAMALEWGRHGINVNAICPGYIDTEINHHHWQTEQAEADRHAAAPRVGTPAGPGRGADDAGLRREPLHQRRHHQRRRRLCGLMGIQPASIKRHQPLFL